MKVDFALIEIDAGDTHLHRIAEGIAKAAALATQALRRRVIDIVVGAEMADVHQAFDEDVAELDKDAKSGDGTDDAGVVLTDVGAHILALQPGHDVAGRLVGASFGHRAMFAERWQLRRQGGQSRRIRLGVGAQGAMQEEVGVAPDR